MPIREKFIGTWNLAHWDVQTTDGQHYTYPYGKEAKGSIIYTEAGRMTAMLMQLNRPKFEIPHSWKGTAVEIKQAFQGYTAYAGNFKIVGNTVVHQVDMSLFPNWIGIDLVRNYEFRHNDKQLVLSTEPSLTKKGIEIKQVLLWERL